MRKLWTMVFLSFFLMSCQNDEIINEPVEDKPIEIMDNIEEVTDEKPTDDPFKVENDQDINYVKSLDTVLSYTLIEGVYKAETEHFRIRSYGKPNILISYAVDFLEEVHGFYLSHYELDKIPRITLNFYFDRAHFELLADMEGIAGYHSYQDIHLRMPSTFDVSGMALDERIQLFVYTTGVHEFNHILQYNANNFALSTYEERWLLEALAEYESNLILIATGTAVGHQIEMTSYDDFRAEKEYEYEYGPYFIEYLINTYQLTMLEIFKNPNLERYLEVPEDELYTRWLLYMHENYETTLE